MRRRKSSRASASRRLNRQGKGSHSKARSAEPDPGQHPRRERLQELGDRAGDVDVALSRGQPVDAGPHRLADRAQGALLGGREPRRALSAGAGLAVDATDQRPEPERDEDERAVDEEVEQVGEDVVVEEVEAERGQRGGGLAGREQEQQGAVADDVGLGDEAEAGDHDHVGEAEREPELLGLRAGRG